jgi:hypothetical protein
MSKITDADYYLPKIFAVLPLYEASNGTTAPIVIRGIEETTHDESTEYFLKPVAAPRMSVNACLFELLAAFMAKQIELNVAEPVLINVSADFANLCRGKNYFQKVNNSVGINFGTKNFGGGFYTWLPEMPLPKNQQEEALKIFVFDLLIQNADRGHQKANLNTNGKELKIFDHELAFSYTALIGLPATEAWKLDENGVDKYLTKGHLFYKYLKGKFDLPIDETIDSLKAINGDFWNVAKTLIPTQWVTDNFQKIKAHTQNVIANLDNFTNEIKRILS